MRIHTTFVCALLAAFLTACAPVFVPAPVPAVNATAVPAATASQPTSAPQAPALTAAIPPAAVTPAILPAGWQAYTNPAGFAIAYPPTWTAQAQPDSNDGNIHTEALKGAEGEVDLSWGVGFGGACPSGYSSIKAAQGGIQTCYAKNDDGTESWSQINRQLPNTSFSARAFTSDAQQASHDLVLQILGTLTFAAAPVASQPPATPQPPQAPAPAPATTYTDPFAYCAAVGTIDAPDAGYTGPKMPDSITGGLMAALAITNTATTPEPFPAGSVYWRCMDGDVYACAVGANIPCWDKADTNTTPTAAMQSFCKEQPNVDVIPASVTGHSTIYSWSCQNGAPVMGKQVLQVDAQGYPSDFWHQIPAPGAQPASGTPAATAAAASPAATLQPLSATECTALADGMARTLGVKVTTGEAPISYWPTEQSGTACEATATGTGAQFKSPDAVVKQLGDMLVSMGWQEDPNLLAGGPTGYGDGYRKDGQMCQAGARWQPSADANCPKDQPISACNVTPEQQVYIITLDCAQSIATPPPATMVAPTAPAPGMANPASVNCTEQGGMLVIQTNGTGGQYGVCSFEDNRQCEEWALMRGDCPAGGVKVTGYVTPAAQYCAITGGTYTVTGNSNTPNETGTCTLKDGKQCDAAAYWNGEC